MEEITQLAEKLGKAIAGSPQAKKLRDAREQLRQEEGLSETLDEYREQSDKIAKLEAENKPVEVEDKHKLRDLHEKLAGSEAFKKYTAAQMDYVDLMRKVNQSLQQHLSETEVE